MSIPTTHPTMSPSLNIPPETWGKTFTGDKPQHVYRFLFQNVNNLSANEQVNMETSEMKLSGIQQLAPDCVMIAEAGVNWDNARQLTASKRTFYNILGKGSVQTSHNIYAS